jgi:glucosamine kinase
MIEYLIGIDGGGTGTSARVAPVASPQQPIGVGQAGPSALRQGVASAWTQLEVAIRAAFVDANIPQPAWQRCALGAGLSGVGHLPLREEFLARNPGFAHIALDTDGFVTLLGAHGGAPGAIVAFGTGSVGEVLRADGSRDVVSGWGFPVGDEGSGAWMGLRAMQVAQAAMDRRAPAGALAHGVCAVVCENSGNNRAAIQTWCIEAWRSGAAQFAYAQLAPIVFDCAAHDAAADNILRDASAALEDAARALDPDARLPLTIAGSIGLRLIERLDAKTRSRIVPAKADAATGALSFIAQSLPQRRQQKSEQIT